MTRDRDPFRPFVDAVLYAPLDAARLAAELEALSPETRAALERALRDSAARGR